MVLSLSQAYSDTEIERMYRKVVGPHLPALLHIHIDAHERISEPLAEELKSAGFARDDFLLGAAERAPNTPWPAQHFTWKGNLPAAFRRAWLKADELLLEHGVWSYLEGELVRLDAVLDAESKPEFDALAFNRLCPVVTSRSSETLRTFDSPVVDRAGNVIGSQKRELPFGVIRRNLRPFPGPASRTLPRDADPAELFRSGEVHLTVRRTGMDVRLLTLLKAVGLSDPIIPKRVVDAMGRPLERAGTAVLIEDMPMTLQAVKAAPALIALFDLIVKRILADIGGVGERDIEGLERVSIKYEPAPIFGLYNGRHPDGSVRCVFDPRTDLPLVVAAIVDRHGGELSTEMLIELGGSADSIGGHPLVADSRLPGLAGLWPDLRNKSRWPSAWSTQLLAQAARDQLAR